MGKADRISGAFWFIFSVFIGYVSYKLGLGVLREPGPGFLFFWTAVVIGIMSLIVVVRSVREKSEEGTKGNIFEQANLRKIVSVLIALFAYALLVERIGFIPVTLLLFIFLLGVIEKKRWYLAVGISLVVTAFAYLVFETALQSQLPKGILEFLRY